MSAKIKIDFNKQAFENDNLKFEKAVELIKLIDIEFKKIDIPIDKNKLLAADDVQGFIVQQYWHYAENLFPKGVVPLKALLMTDFELGAIVRYVIELRSLSKVFAVKGIDVVSKIDKETYNIYCSKDKEEEYKLFQKIIDDLLKVEQKSHQWQYQLQNILGGQKIIVPAGIPIPNSYYFSH
jgi:hypothetical protein